MGKIQGKTSQQNYMQLKEKETMRKLIYILALLLCVTTNAQCWLAQLGADMKTGSPEFKNFITNNADGWSSYELLFHARGANSTMKTDMALLNKVSQLQNDAVFLQKIGGQKGLENIITANVRARCKSCGTSGAAYLKHMDEYLDDVHHFVTNYHAVPGFSNVLTDIKKINQSGSASTSVEGTAFMLRVLKKEQSLFAGNITRFEGSIDDALNGCKYDIVFASGSRNNFGEFKSYADNSMGFFLKNGGDTYQQFTTYLSTVRDIRSLHYYFDLGKISDINIIKNRLKIGYRISE
jgi:hypothetical protein